MPKSEEISNNTDPNKHPESHLHPTEMQIHKMEFLPQTSVVGDYHIEIEWLGLQLQQSGF